MEKMKIFFPPTDGGYGIALVRNMLAVLTPCCSELVEDAFADGETLLCLDCTLSVPVPMPELGFLARVDLAPGYSQDFTAWARYWTCVPDIECHLNWVD